MQEVVPYVGTWIEILLTQQMPLWCLRRSLRGNVDRNPEHRGIVRKLERRSLRGNVDRNTPSPSQWIGSHVVPYVGTWIEIIKSLNVDAVNRCRSLRGNVDRNYMEDDFSDYMTTSFPTWERG